MKSLQLKSKTETQLSRGGEHDQNCVSFDSIKLCQRILRRNFPPEIRLEKHRKSIIMREIMKSGVRQYRENMI